MKNVKRTPVEEKKATTVMVKKTSTKNKRNTGVGLIMK